jgi:hypothetical protein
MTTNPFRYFKNSPEIIHLAVMLYVRLPLSQRHRRRKSAAVPLIQDDRGQLNDALAP